MARRITTKVASGPEQSRRHPERDGYAFRLYVAGATPASIRAITNVKGFCEQRLTGRYQLEVIDIYQQPHLAESAQIIAVPTLFRAHPTPMRRLIGDFSRSERVLTGLLACDDAIAPEDFRAK